MEHASIIPILPIRRAEVPPALSVPDCANGPQAAEAHDWPDNVTLDVLRRHVVLQKLPELITGDFVASGPKLQDVCPREREKLLTLGTARGDTNTMVALIKRALTLWAYHFHEPDRNDQPQAYQRFCPDRNRAPNLHQALGQDHSSSPQFGADGLIT